MNKRIHKGIASVHPFSFNNILSQDILLAEELINFYVNELVAEEQYVYICAPLKATSKKSGKEHVFEALSYASRIAGGKYNGKNTLLWIPHLHGLSIYNEYIYPHHRNHGLDFTISFLKVFKPIIVICGDIISGGMKGELEFAKKQNLRVFNHENFKQILKNVPAEKEIQKILELLIKSYPENFLNHPALNKK